MNMILFITLKYVASYAGIDYRPPEHNLKVFKWSFLEISYCREIGVPRNGDKSQLVELLHDTEV